MQLICGITSAIVVFRLITGETRDEEGPASARKGKGDQNNDEGHRWDDVFERVRAACVECKSMELEAVIWDEVLQCVGKAQR